jgi:hypothetical protein
MPALERNHAYHFKMTPGLMLGPRCNHDLGILLRLPVLDDHLKEALLKAWHRVQSSGRGTDDTEEPDEEAARGVSRLSDESIDAMIEVMVDHEYYASDYASKDQPQAANLLHTLHDSLVRHDRFAAEREVAGTIDEGMDRARRLLQSFVSATNRRLHKGFPSIYAYLLGKPNHYASHLFQPWTFQHDFMRFDLCFQHHWLRQTDLPGTTRQRASHHPSPSSFTFLNFDYDFRAMVMANFPYYYFIAGTQCVAVLNDGLWNWYTAQPEEKDLHRTVLVNASGETMVRYDHPCYRDGGDSRLFIRSKTLRDEVQ